MVGLLEREARHVLRVRRGGSVGERHVLRVRRGGSVRERRVLRVRRGGSVRERRVLRVRRGGSVRERHEGENGTPTPARMGAYMVAACVSNVDCSFPSQIPVHQHGTTALA